MRIWVKEVALIILVYIKKITWKIKYKVIFDFGSRVSFHCVFEGRNRIKRGAYVARTKMGYGTYVGTDARIISCDIGRFTSIGPNVKITSGKHPTHTFVSTHPAFYSLRKQVGFTFSKEQLFEEGGDFPCQTIIGNDVWIGDSALVLEGITIGDGGIVAAGSVVTKSVPPYAIVAGVPAKVVRYRFNDEQIRDLLDIKWWDRDQSWLREHIDNFANIDNFIKVTNAEKGNKL